MKKVLDVFSQAFVINPPANRERLALITQRLRDLGIEFERFPALQFDGSSHREALRAVNLSHLEAVKEARRRNLENVLIMEDDAIFRPDFLRLWSILLPQLQTLDYDILYGYNWHNTSSSISDMKITPIAGTYCNHFWSIRSYYYETFIESVALNEQKETPLPIDLIFTCKNARMYAPTYNLVGQDAGVSGILKVMKPLRWSAAD